MDTINWHGLVSILLNISLGIVLFIQHYRSKEASWFIVWMLFFMLMFHTVANYSE